ncbi:MAG: hypothetical protein V7707_08240 [Motiliproteus sp.]
MAVQRLVARLFPELLAGYHLPVFAVVESIADAPIAGGLADPYRPRYAVNLQLLDQHGQPDTHQPLIEAVPVTVPGAGMERGLFGLPQPGAIVEVAWAYGRPDQPFVRSVLPHRQSLPECGADELLWQQRDGVSQKADSAGNWHRDTDGQIADRSQTHLVETLEKLETIQNELKQVLEHSVEQVDGIKLIEAGAIKLLAEATAHIGSGGSLNITAAQDQNQSAGGSINQVAGADLNQDIAADLIQAIAGKVAQVVTGNIDQTTDGNLTQTAAGSITQTATGTASLLATGALTMKGSSVWIGSPTINVLALVSSFMDETKQALTALSTHTHTNGQVDQQAAIAGNATAVGNTKSTLDGLQP